MAEDLSRKHDQSLAALRHDLRREYEAKAREQTEKMELLESLIREAKRTPQGAPPASPELHEAQSERSSPSRKKFLVGSLVSVVSQNNAQGKKQ